MAAHLDADDAAPASSPPSGGQLDLVQRATTRRCLVRFEYKGEQRVVHPARVHSGPSGWYLSGREELPDGDGIVKEFVVSRMSEVSLDVPGSAAPVDEPQRPSLDPLTWLQDPPTEVVVEVPGVHRLLAQNLLGDPAHVSPQEDAQDAAEDAAQGGTLLLTYVVTNRAVFRWRLYELGTRVRVQSPQDVRQEMVAELESFLGRTP